MFWIREPASATEQAASRFTDYFDKFIKYAQQNKDVFNTITQLGGGMPRGMNEQDMFDESSSSSNRDSADQLRQPSRQLRQTAGLCRRSTTGSLKHDQQDYEPASAEDGRSHCSQGSGEPEKCFQRIITAGLKVMYDPKTNDMMAKLKSQSDPAEIAGAGVAKLLGLLMNQSRARCQ